MIAKDPVTPITVAKLSKITSKTIETRYNSHQQFITYKICTTRVKEKRGVGQKIEFTLVAILIVGVLKLGISILLFR
jgi:hypothetical protein